MFPLPPEQIRPSQIPDQKGGNLCPETPYPAIKLNHRMVMNTTTRTLIRDIQSKLKNPITKQREFNTDTAVIDYAIKTLHDLLKQQRLL